MTRTTMQTNKTMYSFHQITTTMLLIVTRVVAAQAQEETTSQAARENSKPFYLRDIQITDTLTLPFSPVTVFVMLLSAVMISGIFSAPKSSATASHILLDGKDAQDKLEKMKKDIKGDYTKFQNLAKTFSKCPSGMAEGGRLGVFTPGMMVPAFDKAIFSKENNIGEVIGPIQTSFGWHLIWIEERKLVE
mmetsp:Transcript_18747/g.40785  ORF Transcript_18747/g.40785 Transcript_18747/m.40785 type:complete len:190 (-) Transcript_18747:713-1282(-)